MESCVFYLHHRVTFGILMACCIIVMFHTFVGNPISCTETLEMSPDMFTSYRWSHSTNSVITAYGTKPMKDVTYSDADAYDYIKHDYYEWIYLLLFVQGVFFYIPHCLWESMEDGRMRRILDNTINLLPAFGDDDIHGDETMTRNDKIFGAARYFHKHMEYCNKYAFLYWGCEIMALLNVIFQIYLLDYLFQGEFIPLGQRGIEQFIAGHFYGTSIFPRFVKCNFRRYGPSGNMDTFDIFCVLPLSSLTEKIYLFIWFWFAFLLILSCATISLMILNFVYPRIRSLRLAAIVSPTFGPVSEGMTLLAYSVGERISFGDWFALSALSKRMDDLDFKMFLVDIHSEIILSERLNKSNFRIYPQNEQQSLKFIKNK